MFAPIALSFGISLGVAADEGPSLRTLAAATNRPPECAALARGGARPSVWQLARLPRLASYCDLLARAHASLGADPGSARKHAESAMEIMPGRAAPLVVIGRVLQAGGDAKGALAAFEKAIAVDPGAVDDPRAMYAHARALTEEQRFTEAAALYRLLVSRAGLLPEPAHGLVHLQAALTTMNAVTRAEDKAAALDAAASFVAEARDMGGDHAPDVVLVSALIFERKGAHDRTAALLAEAKRIGAHVDDESRAYVASAADLAALRALDAEVNDPSRAAKEWKAYADALGPSSPWAGSVGVRKATPGPAKKPGKAPAKKAKK